MEKRYLGSSQIRADQETLRAEGLESDALLLRAIGQLEVALLDRYGDSLSGRMIHVLVGPGNNGADGLGLAEALKKRGLDLKVWLSADAKSDLNKKYLDRVKKIGLTVNSLASLRGATPQDLLIDALFGVSFRGEFDEGLKEALQSISRCGCEVVAIDLPSGVDADTGVLADGSLKADLTLSLGLPKYVSALPHLRNYFGEILELDIGLRRDLIEADVLQVEASDLRELLPPERRADAHKYSFGRLQIFAGSPEYPGALRLIALGAFKSGCGYVAVQSSASHEILRELPEIVPAFLPAAQSFVLGPGLDSPGVKDAQIRIAEIPKERPLLLDGGILSHLESLRFEMSSRPNLVLTPHEGEMAQLLGTPWTPELVRKDRIAALRRCREFWPSATILLKGSGTLVASRDEVFLLTWGNASMASAGQGDLLAGVIGAYLAMGLELQRACILGSAICGIAAERLSQGREAQGVLAHEIADMIPLIVKEIREYTQPLPKN